MRGIHLYAVGAMVIALQGCVSPYTPPPNRQGNYVCHIAKFNKLEKPDGRTFAVLSTKKDVGIEEETYLEMVEQRLQWFTLRPAPVIEADYIVMLSHSANQEPYLIDGTTRYAFGYHVRIQFFSGDSFRSKRSEQLLDWKITLAGDRSLAISRAMRALLNEAFTSFPGENGETKKYHLSF